MRPRSHSFTCPILHVERRLHRSKLRQAAPPAEKKQFTAEDFSYDLDRMACVCPAGHKLYQAGKDMLFNGYRVARFKAPITACRRCPLRAKCLRKPDRTPQRQLTIIKHTEGPPQQAKPNKHSPTERMRTRRRGESSTASEWERLSPSSATSKTRACAALRCVDNSRSTHSGSSSPSCTTSRRLPECTVSDGVSPGSTGAAPPEGARARGHENRARGARGGGGQVDVLARLGFSTASLATRHTFSHHTRVALAICHAGSTP